MVKFLKPKTTITAIDGIKFSTVCPELKKLIKKAMRTNISKSNFGVTDKTLPKINV